VAWLAKAAPYLQGAGTVLSVLSNERGAKSDARQLRYQAGQARASSQRAAAEERRRARILDSRARAVAAKSGAGVTDPTVVNVRSDIEGEGVYRALSRMYEGETEAASLEFEAQERRRAARGRSIATVLDSAATFASKYG
jgi:hypothetical protein